MAGASKMSAGFFGENRIAVVCAAAGALLLAEYIYRKLKKKPSCRLGPKHVPFLGHLPRLPEMMHQRLDKMVDDFEEMGDEQTLTLDAPLIPSMVVTIDPKNVDWILKTNFVNYPKGWYFINAFKQLLGDGIFNADDDKWKVQRKRAAPMFSLAMLQYMYESFLVHAEELREIVDNAAESGEELELYSLFNRYTLTCVGEIGFGVQLNCLRDPNHTFMAAFDRANAAIECRLYHPWWPLEKLFGFPRERQLARDIATLNSLSLDIVRQRRQQIADSNNAQTEARSALRSQSIAEPSPSHTMSRQAQNPTFGAVSRNPCLTVSPPTSPARGNAQTSSTISSPGQATSTSSTSSPSNRFAVPPHISVNAPRSPTGSAAGNPSPTEFEDPAENRTVLRVPASAGSKLRRPSLPSTQGAQSLLEGALKVGKRDFLSVFMVADPKLTDAELRDMVLNFLIAGKDTTGQALSWTLYELMRHPECLEKCREEIAAVKAKNDGSVPFDEARSGLPYVTAVLHEALRLHPSVPWEMKMCRKDDTWPDGTFVPAGTLTIFAPYAMGRNKKVWGEDAKEFKPERWLAMKTLPSFSVYPVFQGGPRECLGKYMAMIEMKTALAAVLDAFVPKPTRDLSKVTYGNALTLNMDPGLFVKVERRAN
uniref:Cytochrome P450 n=1 Tax=Chromera velia CCMP2878 TaxID=1169474 RepID=A0A0G4GHM7_9ALVE|mmetsp:Transcript_53663/g.104929  ORF Transcript_53663/g.104929 Transcript_53663/m.104929 type:complete len:651 (-) Transcript_53663:1792-3744(-)|eukprot:Cvel_21934.t1-p1 / transcript=Cvel_21934.t1 / gene=Cvel_21934 / organism=Chromera_velia_CCMP2878 / gene_product=Cytochrome P450 704C1, putative / transcript_product=Cytochrome P450 704C1, putative / location=Cvel_scaffold2104:7084-11213(+) / protein_length=650 / sequence_SO=supercontig / SO=protein_coding / is_pseudo=false